MRLLETLSVVSWLFFAVVTWVGFVIGALQAVVWVYARVGDWVFILPFALIGLFSFIFRMLARV